MEDHTRTATNRDHGRSATRSVPTLRVLYTAHAGIELAPARQLSRGVTSIGRESRELELATLAEDTLLSRRHAVISYDEAAELVQVSDAGSRNGTFRNGERVETSVMDDGDVIRVGSSLLLLRFEPPGFEDAPIPGLTGRSPAIRTVRSLVARVAPTAATVLLLGESGVGKGVTARAIHDFSGRAGEFVSVNCATIPETLAESQLFGHIAGAFTGARRDHVGFFRSADGGTLFLDEVAELSAPVQAKLLGVLEERRVTPVGSVQSVPCDVRLVAATNADLSQAVQNRTFRGDLSARLSEFMMVLPPLRARREDILPIFATAFEGEMPKLSPALAEALLLHDWPFNVRELVKVGIDLKIRGQGCERLELEMVADRLTGLRRAEPFGSTTPSLLPSGPAVAPPPVARGPIPTREELDQLLREKRGIVSEIAASTGRSRKQIYRWIEQHGLDVDAYREK